MFTTQKEIATRYAVKFEDGNYLTQGKKAIKLYRKCHRAQAALEASLEKGYVVEVSVNEVVEAEPQQSADIPDICDALRTIADGLGKACSVDLYKFSTVTHGGSNVIRYSLIGVEPVHVPGDCYTDLDVHLQVRIN